MAPHPSGFDYSAVPAPARDWLRWAAEQGRGLAYRTACDMIRVGGLLRAARDRLRRRTFRDWVAAELPWSRAHAYRLIAVADAFGPLADARAAERIDAVALYLLARPEVPAEARGYAVELSAERRVTVADAREILDAHRRTPELTAREVKALAPLRPADAARATAPPPAADPARAWLALEDLVRASSLVHVARYDEGGDGDEPLYSVAVYGEAGGPQSTVRRTLADAVLAAAGAEPEKVCPGCEKTRPAGEFGQNRNLPDGRNRYCKTCERARLSAFKKRKRAGGGSP